MGADFRHNGLVMWNEEPFNLSINISFVHILSILTMTLKFHLINTKNSYIIFLAEYIFELIHLNTDSIVQD